MIDDPPLSAVCPFKTYTRARFGWTHGVFTVPHHTPQQKTTQHNNTTTTPHGDRERQRQTETETET